MKILIAEDEAVSRHLLTSYLHQWGHEVVAAPDGAVAWRLFQDQEFPLVLSDWEMPEMDGVELIRHIRGCPVGPYVYIILLTARAQKQDVIAGLEAGANDFVTKPFDRGELRVRLRAGERIIKLERELAAQNRALRETQAALVQTEKLASLGQLAAGMAHEINNPIAYVANNVAVLRRDVPAALHVLDIYRQGREQLRRVVPDIVAEAERMEEDIDLPYIRESLPRLFERSLDGLSRVRDIVRNLRDFARLDESSFKDVDLNAALQSTLEIAAHEIKKKSIDLQTDFAQLPPVLCHPGKINQVFLNVFLNAIQASQRGGTVEVSTRSDETLPSGGVHIDVRDNGCGIAPEHLPHIFDPFFTTKPIGQGTGLGLSVSYGIVRDHGGSIEVESEVGRGTLFRIRLPLRPPTRRDGDDGNK
ncbi:MAG TPA: ATP-binding protein [Gemmataceae bacterium]|nr:ATP-binding protein [Gemmataceae bacterium]